jgi:beta-N-acetylhexosaminidase
LTLRQKVGQLLLIGFQGRNLDAKKRAHIKKLSPGGIVFYRRNFNDASGISSLVGDIKGLLRRNTLPLFFAVDQEGWIVHRVGGELYTPPSAPSIGATGSEDVARETGRAVGRALGSLGVNINLAPVLDVPADIVGSPMTTRCFSNDAALVETLGSSYIRGLKTAGLLATAKHFPGMGRARGDAHNELPRIRWETTAERNNDLYPFIGAIRAGVDIVMTGHVIAEPGDAVNPVSLSEYWMKEILRKEMGFDGLVIVDDVEMKALNGTVSVADAAVKAFTAGADVIMVSHEMRNQRAVFEALLKAVRTGEIPMSRLDESLRRIAKAKEEMRPSTVNVRSNTLLLISKEVAEGSVSDVRRKDAPLGRISGKSRVLYAGMNRALIGVAGEFFDHTAILESPLSEYRRSHPEGTIEDYIRTFDGVIVDASYADAADILSLCDKLRVEHVVLLSTYPAYALNVLAKLRPHRMVITLENSTMHLRTALEIIAGVRQAKAVLPYKIRLPEEYTYAQTP